MAGGKSTKRVNLRSKIARKQQQSQHTGSSADPSLSATDLSHSSALPSVPANAAVGHAEADRHTALQIRDALRQRHGRTGRAPASASSKPSGTSSPSASKTIKKTEEKATSRRLSAKKESKKSTAAMHPAALRRAAVQERRRLLLPQMSAAETRMAAAQEELQLFEKVQTVPAYAADPFAAVMQHLSATMDTLKPQTPDIGRVTRE